MQQKSTQKILLFSVAAQKVEKIKVLCKTLGISVQQVEKSDYGQKLGAIAGITGFKKDGSRYSGADFPAELLVFSGINSSQMDIFLAEYKKAGIEPIGCKAIVTPDNVFWSADKLFREIFREHLFIRAHKSYIVNINKVLSLRINELFLPNNVTIPVSRSYLTNIKKKLLEIAR